MSDAFKLCLVASLASAVPIVLDIFLDSLFLSTCLFRSVKVAIRLLILSSIISSCVALFVVIPLSDYSIMACMMAALGIIILHSCLCILHAYGSTIWKLKYAWPILIFYTLGSISSAYFELSENEALQISFRYTVYTFWAFAGFMLACLSFVWARHLVTRMRSDEHLAYDDYYCSMNLVACVVYCIMEVAIFFYFCGCIEGTSIYIARTYLLSSFIVVIIALNARFIRTATILSSVSLRLASFRLANVFFSPWYVLGSTGSRDETNVGRLLLS